MRELRGYASAVAAASLFGLGNVSVRAATQAGAHPISGAALTYIIAALVLSPFLRRIRVTGRDKGLMLGMVLAGGVIAPLTLFFAFQRTTAVEGSLLLNSEVVFTSILALLVLRERLHTAEWIAFGAILGGVLAITLPPILSQGGFDPGHLVGNLLILVAALGWAADNNFSTPLSRRHDLRTLIAIKGLGGALVLAAAVLVMGAPLTVPLASVPAILFAGLFGFGAASLFFYDALRRIGAARTAILFATGTLLGVAGGHFILGEAVTATHLGGAALMIAGVLALARTGAAPEPPIAA